MTTTAHIAKCPKHGIIARIEATEATRMFRFCNGDVRCMKCGRLADWEAVEGRIGTGKCDARCWDSIRGACKCSCGGTNHATTFGVFERAS